MRRRRRYDPYYDDDDVYYTRRRAPYGYYRRGPSGGSCLRNACLIDAGCCIGESLDGNCLFLGLLTLPQLLAVPVRRGAAPGGAAQAVTAAIRTYQREISPRRPAVCRFSPTCSEYAAQAVRAHGARRGLALAAGRVLRCRPGGRRGADPVPAVRRPRRAA